MYDAKETVHVDLYIRQTVKLYILIMCPLFVEMSTDSNSDLVLSVKQLKLPHSMCAQDGSFNCVLLAARYGHTELFHYLVQTYHCNPRQKDRQTGVREK